MRIASALFFCALSAAAAPASAFPDQTGWSWRNVQEGVLSGYYTGSHVTPTLRRQRIARLTALRDEAYSLQAQDGGTLTAKNINYIRSEAAEILGGRSERRFGSGRPTRVQR